VNNKLKIALVAGLGSIGMVSIVRTGFAQSSINHSIAVVQPQTVAIAAEASDGDGETNDDTQDQQGSAKLQQLAKITPQQATQAAEAKQGGKAGSVKLENENGTLVYAVIVGKTEVIVDASNGRVLSTENN
jgi:uncharacterized membrane protein YkoI